jgi:hypothetical protein
MWLHRRYHLYGMKGLYRLYYLRVNIASALVSVWVPKAIGVRNIDETHVKTIGLMDSPALAASSPCQ